MDWCSFHVVFACFTTVNACKCVLLGGVSAVCVIWRGGGGEDADSFMSNWNSYKTPSLQRAIHNYLRPSSLLFSSMEKPTFLSIRALSQVFEDKNQKRATLFCSHQICEEIAKKIVKILKTVGGVGI